MANNLKKYNEQRSLDNLKPNRNSEIASYIIRIKEISAGADRKDISKMRKCFAEYLRVTAECDFRVGNMACYMALGMSRDTAKFWRSGQAGAEKKAFVEEIDAVCSTYREITAASGEANTIWSIFAAKNYDGMKDQQDVVIAPQSMLGETKSAEELAEKYKELPE